MQTGTITAASGIINDLSANVITAGELKADYIKIDDITLDTTGTSGNQSLIIKSQGVDTAQLKIGAVETDRVTNNAITVNRFSSDATELISSTGTYVEVADLWWQETSAEGYNAFTKAGGYHTHEDTSGNVSSNFFSKIDVELTIQYGSQEPETTAGYTLYGTTKPNSVILQDLFDLNLKGIQSPVCAIQKGNHFIPTGYYIYLRLWVKVDTLTNADRVKIIEPFIETIGLKK